MRSISNSSPILPGLLPVPGLTRGALVQAAVLFSDFAATPKHEDDTDTHHRDVALASELRMLRKSPHSALRRHPTSAMNK